jgi:hypothetical protein
VAVTAAEAGAAVAASSVPQAARLENHPVIERPAMLIVGGRMAGDKATPIVMNEQTSCEAFGLSFYAEGVASFSPWVDSPGELGTRHRHSLQPQSGDSQ